MNKTYFGKLWREQFTIQAIIIGTIFLFLSAFTGINIYTFGAFILLFTGFDVMGYGNAVHMNQRWNDETITKPYRVMQNMFMFTAFILIYLHSGWLCLLACFAGWWFGGCDLLYYVLLRIKMTDDDYYWMRGWSIWLLYRKYVYVISNKAIMEILIVKGEITEEQAKKYNEYGIIPIKTVIPKFGFIFVGIAGLICGTLICFIKV